MKNYFFYIFQSHLEHMKNSWNTFFLALWMYVVPNTGAPVVRLNIFGFFPNNNSKY